jgi:hypothetical protein
VTGLGLALLGMGLACAVAAWKRRSFALGAVALFALAGACWPWNDGGDDIAALVERARDAQTEQAEAQARFDEADAAIEAGQVSDPVALDELTSTRADAARELSDARAEFADARAAARRALDDAPSRPAFATAREAAAIVLGAAGAFALGAACARLRAGRRRPSIAWPSIFAQANPAPPIIDRENAPIEAPVVPSEEDEPPKRTRPPILQPASTVSRSGADPAEHARRSHR